MRVLYLIHISWEWIFQRPQIIEKLMEEDFECTVLNKKYILRPTTTKNNIQPAEMKYVYQLPMSNKINLFRSINNWIYKRKLKTICNDYDAIWVCYPELGACIPKEYKGKIIYDCMDNHVSMAKNEVKEKLRKYENELIERSDLNFVSSLKLKSIIPGLENAILVRNGFSGIDLKYSLSRSKANYKIGYFGTVAPWFDFDLIYDSVKERNNVEYHIIGPLDNGFSDIDKARDKNVIFEGVVEHKNLQNYVEDYDALIMPFVVNDIILSVDPVKLYEYICMGKCVISVWYPEIDRFSPYVYFYKSKEEYFKLLDELEANGYKPKYTQKEQVEFLNDNTWEKRYEIIKQSINEIMR